MAIRRQSALTSAAIVGGILLAAAVVIGVFIGILIRAAMSVGGV